jgi:hypothetical protein
VQEADDDDDERGSVTTTGEEEGGCRNASERGGVGPTEQPAQLLWPQAPQCARPECLARRWEPNPISSPDSRCTEGSNWVYKRGSGRSVNRGSSLRTTTLQNQTEPLEIIPLYSDEEKEPDYYLFVTLNLFVVP